METREIMKELNRRPELRYLLKEARNLSDEQIAAVAAAVQAMNRISGTQEKRSNVIQGHFTREA